MFSKLHSQAVFKDRHDAGRQLAQRLPPVATESDILVLALPRGGVPVAFEVARKLSAELDVFLVRKLGLPGQEELAIGAIASGGVRVLNAELLREVELSEVLIEQVTSRERLELHRREQFYRDGRPAARIAGRPVILVDDGLATGASMKAACQAVRALNPTRMMVAVPVAARETCRELEHSADQIVCLATPSPFYAVGNWYEDFSQTSDEEVRSLLAHSA